MLLDRPRVRRAAGVSGPADPASVAVLLALLSIGALLASPVQNAASRAVEVRADRDSILATGDDAAFVQVQRELALHSLSDPTPPLPSYLWFGSHPTVLQRAGIPASMAEAAR